MPYGNINVDTVTTSTAGGILGAGNASIMKNRIINGAMVISQRNGTSSVTPVNDGLTLDRWKWDLSAASKLTSQQSSTAPIGFNYSMLVTSSSAYTVGASEQFLVYQSIEGFNFADCGWGTADAKTVTLSFWVRSSLTGTFGGALRNSATNRSYPYSYTISAANTWEQKSITISGDTTGTWEGATNGTGVIVNWSLGAGSNLSGTAGAWVAGSKTSVTGATSVVGTNGATFYITGVQLEVGSSATGFEYRQYGQELALCQRYFQKVSCGVICCCESGTTQVLGTVLFPTCMRSTPSVSPSAAMRISDVAYSGFVQSSASASIATSNSDSVRVRMPNFSGLTEGRWYQQTNDSSAGVLQFSAEL